MPGERGLLWRADWPARRRRAASTRRPRPRSTRAIEAVAGAARAGATTSARRPARASRRGSRPTATSATAEHVARLARVEVVRGRRRAGRHRRGARAAASQRAAVRGGRRRRPSAPRAAERDATLEAEIERAERKLANQGFVAKAPGRRRGGRARQARATAARSWRRCDSLVTLEHAEDYLLSLELFGMRFGLDRMRRLMTVLGCPQRAVRVDPRGRHERQVLDRAHVRGAPRGATACAPALHVAAPAHRSPSGSGSATPTSTADVRRRRRARRRGGRARSTARSRPATA